MLAALLLLGILPFAAMPFLGGDEAESDEAEPGDEPESAASGHGDMLDGARDASAAPDLPEAAPDDTQSDAGETYALDTSSGDMTFDDFLPGTDLVELDLTGLNGDPDFDIASDDQGASVSFSVGQEPVSTLHFRGLAEVPASDISLTLSDPESGETFQVFLSDAMAAAEAGPDALDPVDPLAPDNPEAAAGAESGIAPVDPDAPDDPGPPVDETSVLDPLDPEAPETADPVAPDAALDPVDPDAEVLGPEGDLALRDLLERESGTTAGIGDALDAALDAGVVDTSLSDGDDSFDLPEDGLDRTGNGSLSLAQGTPVLSTLEPMQVVDGGAGDDMIGGGDDAAYVFGGEGNDTLSAGDGAMALFGEGGQDILTATGATGSYLDGGNGDDAIFGGSGDDILEGGEHAVGDGGGGDLIDGGAGNDLIRGGFGADTLIGGAGDDVIDHLGRAEEREIAEHHEFAWHIDGAADSLEGGAGDDTLIMDRADIALGGEGQDLFWIYHDGVDGGSAAEVADFKVGEDFLRVSLNPQIGENGLPDVTVAASDDGLDGLVTVNGDLVAILRGAPTATASDVYAEVTPDVFP